MGARGRLRDPHHHGRAAPGQEGPRPRGPPAKRAPGQEGQAHHQRRPARSHPDAAPDPAPDLEQAQPDQAHKGFRVTAAEFDGLQTLAAMPEHEPEAVVHMARAAGAGDLGPRIWEASSEFDLESTP